MDLIVRPVTPDRWEDLVRFFGPSGAYANCWCTYFRQRGKDFEAGCRNRGAGNRRMLERLTKSGGVPGLLAYWGDRDASPVGWVSVAPREDFARVLRSPILRPGGAGEPNVWSVVCFWMPREHRGHGVATELLTAAVEYARTQGAVMVEGYPVDTGGERRPNTSLYTGTVSLFAAAGFVEAYRRNPTRPVMQRRLR